VAACPRCGYENADGVDFCGNPDCRADLRPILAQEQAPFVATGAGPGPAPADAYPPPPPPPPPPPASGATRTTGPPPGEQKKGMRITADPLELRVEPGGPPASTTVTVRNRGTKVEHFELAVNGPIAAFAQVQPPVLQVFPDTEETAQVRFAVPRASLPPAGPYSFQIAARGRVDPDVTGRVAGALTVGRFDEMIATIEPEMTRGRRPGHHRLTVANRGNGSLDVQVAMADQQGELVFDPSRFGGPIGPGGTATEDVVVRAPLKWFGRTQVHPFTGNVTADAPGQAAMVQARRRQVPRFPWWVPTAVLAVLALAIPVYALLPGHKVPTVASLDRVAAAAALSDAGYRPVQIEQPDEAVPKDIAIKTEPDGGAALGKGERVRLFVSSGPCRGACPVAVPDVTLLTVAEATQDLTAAQFVVDRVAQIIDPNVPAGNVISTSPAAGTKADVGSKIVLTASSGPPAAPTSAAGPGPTQPNPAPPVPPPGGGGGGGGGAGAPVVIPADVVGQPLATVTEKLKNLGLLVTATPTRSNKVPRDAVLSSLPAPGAQAPAGSTVKLEVGVPTGPVDLLAAAPAAAWTDETGSPLTFGTPAPGRGFAGPLAATAVIEDGTSGPGLTTVPNPVQGATVVGTFTLPGPVIAGDHLRASVGLLQGGSGVDDFLVRAGTADLTPVVHAVADRKLDVLDVDLTPAVGVTAVQIVVTAGANGPGAPAVWKDLRIEGQIG
jgi:beta-lactam-binding protein with PASTA domain